MVDREVQIFFFLVVVMVLYSFLVDGVFVSCLRSFVMVIEFKFFDVGDNIEKGIVVMVFVNFGDSVIEGQFIIEIEIDKVVVEVLVSVVGIIEVVNVKVGDIILVGGVIVILGGGVVSVFDFVFSVSVFFLVNGGGDQVVNVEFMLVIDSGIVQCVVQVQQDVQKEQVG